MLSGKLVSRKNLSSWLLSLTILLSIIGFSGSVNTAITQKQTLTENVKRLKVSKTQPSFNRLHTELISKDFFALLAQQHAELSEVLLKSRVVTAFQNSSRASDCIITFVEQIRFRFRARDIATHSFLRA